MSVSAEVVTDSKVAAVKARLQTGRSACAGKTVTTVTLGATRIERR
jgi:hypothetical protein